MRVTKRFYVSIDELLDTRLGFIHQHNSALANRYLTTDIKRYLYRMHDSVLWDDLGLTETEWYQAWEQRHHYGNKILEDSVLTHVPNIINRILFEYHESNEHAIGEWKVAVDVNLFNYPLTEEEISVLEEILRDLMPGISVFNFIRLGIKDLTPETIKKRYDYIIMYNFNFWSKLHSNSITNFLMPNCLFVVPRLFNVIPENEDVEKDRELKRIFELDPFKLIESTLSYKMGLVHAAVSDFGPSFIPPITKQADHEDLDDLLDLSESYIPDSSQSDPLFQFHQESGYVMVVEKGQALSHGTQG